MSPLTEAARELLVGKKVAISIGEPWDFVSEVGPGALEGRIVALSQPGADKDDQWVELEVTPFASEEGPEVRCVVVHARYYDEMGIAEQLAAGEKAPANLNYSQEIPDEERDSDVSPFLIGSVRLSED